MPIRENTQAFSLYLTNQCMNPGLLGLLCPISVWCFPFVCSRSDGLSISNRVLLASPSYSVENIVCAPETQPHIVRNARPHGEATYRYCGDSLSKGLSWPPTSTTRHGSEWASGNCSPSLHSGTADVECRVKLSHRPFLQVLTKLQFVTKINYVIVSSH